MAERTDRQLLQINLIIPVTEAAKNLAATIERAKQIGGPIDINGYGHGKVMANEHFQRLAELADKGLEMERLEALKKTNEH